MPSTPCARTGAQPGGRSLSEAADGFGDVVVALKLIHALQAMSDGECSVSERAFRDHARSFASRPTGHGAPGQRRWHATARARTNNRTCQSS